MSQAMEIIYVLESEKQRIIQELEQNNIDGMPLCLKTDLEELLHLTVARTDLIIELELVDKLLGQAKAIVGVDY